MNRIKRRLWFLNDIKFIGRPDYRSLIISQTLCGVDIFYNRTQMFQPFNNGIEQCENKLFHSSDMLQDQCV